MPNSGRTPLRRALIVSPNRAFTQTHLACLRHCGLEDFAASADGIQAAKTLRDAPFDLVLCEDALRDMDGLDFLRLVRLHPDLARIPAIMVSSDGRSDTVREAVEAGFSGFLVKPYSLKAMERQVARAASNGGPPSPEATVEAFDRTLDQLILLTGASAGNAETRKGISLLREGQYARAKEAFLKAESSGALTPEAQLGLAKAHQGLMELKAARRCLQEALQCFAAREKLMDAAERFPSLKIVPDPQGEISLTAQLARASYFFGSTKQARKNLESGAQALECLQRRIVGQPRELDENDLLQPRTIGELRLYLSIIGHTIKTYFKSAGATKRMQ